MTKSIAKYLPRYLVFSLCLLLWVSSIAAVLAQDETPPVEPPTATFTPSNTPTVMLTPTLTPSEPPTFTPTSQPTLTDTPSPTLTPTATETTFVTESPAVTAEFTDTPSGTPSLTVEPSLTVTPTASLTASETPTGTTTPTSTPLSPEPPLTLLFADAFDATPLPIWTFGSGWSVVASEGGQALQALNTEEPTTLTFDTLLNVVVRVRVQFNTGAVRLFARESEVGSYSVTLDTLGNVSLYRAGILFGIGSTHPASPDQWRILRLSVINDVIRVSVDGIEVLAVADDAPLPPGKLGFAGVQLGEQALLVDDVEVWLPSNELPAPTPPPTEVAPIGLSAQALQAVTGRDIAFMNGVNFMTSSVQVLDGNGNTILTRNGGFPEWSITEKYLAYLSTAPQVNRHNFETNETEALGNTTTLILPRINGTFWDPVWSPSTTNNQIAFVWSRETERVDIYVMNADGTNLHNLTTGSPDPINFLPAWSPDGQWIAFTSTNFAATSYRVRIIRADGSGSVITVNTAPANGLLPFWAGDGSHLAFWVITTDPTNPSFAMVTFNTSTGAIGSVQAFNPGTTDWGRVWVPGGGQYASMASFNPATRVFQLLYSGDGSLIGTGWFPKWRPTYTPWVITVSPDALIPPIARETDQECPLLIDNTIPEQGIACALRTYREYGASLTWTQLVALILHAEGNSFLISSTGCTDNTFPGIPAPLVPQPTPPAPTPTPTPIPVPVNFVSSSCNPTVHQEFVYAIVEQMFNKCDDPADVANNVGQCSEEGLLLFLGQVQRYRENMISDASTYAALAHQEIEHFLNGTGGRVFGRCPCTTGNVRTVEEAQQGQVRNVNDPRYQAYAQTLYPRFWYSYSYFDNETGAAAAFRYLKIY